MKKWLCILAVLAALLCAGCGSEKTEETKAAPAMDFTLEDESGREVKLSEYYGRPIVLNLWASWCTPCMAEMPHFEQAYKTYGDVQFMMVNLTVSDDPETAQQLIQEKGYSFPVFYDTTGAAAMALNASSIPVTVFIDAQGNVKNHKVGMLSNDELEENIRLICE